MSKLSVKPVKGVVAIAVIAATAMLTAIAASPAAAQSNTAEVPPLQSCVDKSAVLVASDAQAQSDVLSAITLAAATDSCLILAGDRDDSTVAPTQLQRVVDSEGVSYIVGGTAAVSLAKQMQADATAATRFGGADRYETARLVGEYLADHDSGDASDESDGDVATADLGVLTASRSHTAPAGQTDVSATLAQARWRITAQSQVPAGKRIDTAFDPALTPGECFDGGGDPGERTDRHQFVWDIKANPDGDCDDAENRSVSVALNSGDLSDFSDPDSDEAVWGWTVKFERRPAVNVPSPTSVTNTSRETLTPTVIVPTDGRATRQVIRLGQGGWLLHVIDQAAGGISGGDAEDLNAAKYGVDIDDVVVIFQSDRYDDTDRYDADRYRCVVAADAEDVGANMSARWSTTAKPAVVVDATTGGKYTTADTGSGIAIPDTSSVHDALAVWVPRGCAGYVAVQVATPNGDAVDTDDVKRWRVQAIPLAPASS